MARMKDLLLDLEEYTELSSDEQKKIREMYNLTLADVKNLQNIRKTINEISILIEGE